jgi:hypothetical protein
MLAGGDLRRDVLPHVALGQLLDGVEGERKEQEEEENRPAKENVARHRLRESATHCFPPFGNCLADRWYWGGGCPGFDVR